MVETVFFDWGLSLATGLAFAAAGGEPLRAARSRVRTKTFRTALAYEVFGVLAIALVMYVWNRDWMWMYWVDPRTLPVAVEVLAFAMYPIVFTAGFFLGSEVPSPVAWRAWAGVGAVLLVATVVARTRVLHFGDLAAFSAGQATPASEFPAQLVTLALLGALSFAALAGELVKIHRTPA